MADQAGTAAQQSVVQADQAAGIPIDVGQATSSDVLNLQWQAMMQYYKQQQVPAQQHSFYTSPATVSTNQYAGLWPGQPLMYGGAFYGGLLPYGYQTGTTTQGTTEHLNAGVGLPCSVPTAVSQTAEQLKLDGGLKADEAHQAVALASHEPEHDAKRQRLDAQQQQIAQATMGVPAVEHSNAVASHQNVVGITGLATAAASSDYWRQAEVRETGVDLQQLSMGQGDLVDERELKKQRRKQSNRESARRSRLRKQAECESLEVRVKELQTENDLLHEQVRKLRARIENLERGGGTPQAVLLQQPGRQEAMPVVQVSTIGSLQPASAATFQCAAAVRQQEVPKISPSQFVTPSCSAALAKSDATTTPTSACTDNENMDDEEMQCDTSKQPELLPNSLAGVVKSENKEKLGVSITEQLANGHQISRQPPVGPPTETVQPTAHTTVCSHADAAALTAHTDTGIGTAIGSAITELSECHNKHGEFAIQPYIEAGVSSKRPQAEHPSAENPSPVVAMSTQTEAIIPQVKSACKEFEVKPDSFDQAACHSADETNATQSTSVPAIEQASTTQNWEHSPAQLPLTDVNTSFDQAVDHPVTGPIADGGAVLGTPCKHGEAVDVGTCSEQRFEAAVSVTTVAEHPISSCERPNNEQPTFDELQPHVVPADGCVKLEHEHVAEDIGNQTVPASEQEQVAE